MTGEPEDDGRKTAGFVDITPSWVGVASLIITGLQNGTPTGVRLAKDHLLQMAKAADMIGEYERLMKLAIERVAVLEEALKPFADEGYLWLRDSDSDTSRYATAADELIGPGFPVGALRAAATAILHGKQDDAPAANVVNPGDEEG